MDECVDVAFLISNYFKKERRGGKSENDVLFTELGGRTPVL
jgi:3-deoxy-7-phosphoheptulonate synthase